MSARRAQEAYDQVVRLQEFSGAHPQVSIEHKSAPAWHWIATWTDTGGELHTITVSDRANYHPLKGLLDRLDVVFPG